MIAFALSGGGNRGALQAGALVELLEQDIVPDMLVGTSAGAINAALLALNPTKEGAHAVAEMWETAKQDDFFPGGLAQIGLRLVQLQSLFASDKLRKKAESVVPKDKLTFGDLPKNIKLYITTTNLNKGRLYVWSGDNDPSAPLIDVVLASAAHPVAFPPVLMQDAQGNSMQLVDGGVAVNVPVGIAVKKGATKVYILNVGDYSTVLPDRKNIVDILMRSLDILMMQPFLMDLRHVTDTTTVELHHIDMHNVESGSLFDISKCKELVKTGRQMTQAYLANPTGVGGLEFEPPSFEEVPPGAEIYVPDWMK